MLPRYNPFTADGNMYMKLPGYCLAFTFALTLLSWSSYPAEAVTASYRILHSTNLLGELEPCG